MDLKREELFATHALISDQCFNACVDNFKIAQLDAREELCVHRCTEKYLCLNIRAGQMFGAYTQNSNTVRLNKLKEDEERVAFYTKQ